MAGDLFSWLFKRKRQVPVTPPQQSAPASRFPGVPDDRLTRYEGPAGPFYTGTVKSEPYRMDPPGNDILYGDDSFHITYFADAETINGKRVFILHHYYGHNNRVWPFSDADGDRMRANLDWYYRDQLHFDEVGFNFDLNKPKLPAGYVPFDMTLSGTEPGFGGTFVSPADVFILRQPYQDTGVENGLYRAYADSGVQFWFRTLDWPRSKNEVTLTGPMRELGGLCVPALLTSDQFARFHRNITWFYSQYGHGFENRRFNVPPVTLLFNFVR